MVDKSKYLHKIQLKNKQRIINKQFEKEGLTDEVLKQQIEVNQKRHELDLPDDDEFVFEDFVQ